MTKMNMLQAINNALDTAMAADDKVLCFGEDVGVFGGVFRATSNLQQKYGKSRCFNTPLVEQGVGAVLLVFTFVVPQFQNLLEHGDKLPWLA